MSRPIQVLIVEDSENDALLLVRELRRTGYNPRFERVESREAMAAALAKKTWDLVLSDYTMPNFTGTAAMELVKESGLDLPFIFVSDVMKEVQLPGRMGSLRTIYKGGCQDDLFWIRPPQEVDASCCDGWARACGARGASAQR